MLILMLLIITAGVGGICSVVYGVISSEKIEEKKAAQTEIERVLSGARVLTEEYVARLKQQRQKEEQSLKRHTETLLADMQVFLQAAIIKREADAAQSSLEDIKKKREELAAFALKRLSSMTKEMLRIKQDVTRMQLNLDDMIAEAQSNLDTPNPLLENNVDNAKELPNLLARIKSTNIENSRNFQERGSINVKNEVSKLKELRRFLKDEQIQSVTDPVQLFTELSPDIANFLPMGAVFTIAEAGGKILFSLGGESMLSANLTTEATRSMILQLEPKRYQLILTLSLKNNDMAAEPSLVELAGILEAYITRTLGDGAYSGYIFGENHELVRAFPQSDGVKTSIPLDGWNEIVAANISTYYAEAGITAGGLELSLGLCYELKHVSIAERLQSLIEENPLNSLILAVLVLLTVSSVVIIGFLSWRSSGKRSEKGGARSASALDIRSIKPELGSLVRLQQLNRGHTVGGSRILDYSRNDALKELVIRVRGAGGENAPQQGKAGQIKAHKAGLREYMK